MTSTYLKKQDKIDAKHQIGFKTISKVFAFQQTNFPRSYLSFSPEIDRTILTRSNEKVKQIHFNVEFLKEKNVSKATTDHCISIQICIYDNGIFNKEDTSQ